MNPFVSLAQSNLEALRYGFAHGALKYEVSDSALLQSGASGATGPAIRKFIQRKGYSPQTVMAIIDAIIESRAHAHNVTLLQSLVVTGPEVTDLTNLKTCSRFTQVVENAKKELMLATFALYQGDRILEPIHHAMLRNPKLSVILILNVQRGYGDTTGSDDLLEKSRRDFRAKNWPWEVKPDVSTTRNPSRWTPRTGPRCTPSSSSQTRSAALLPPPTSPKQLRRKTSRLGLN